VPEFLAKSLRPQGDARKPVSGGRSALANLIRTKVIAQGWLRMDSTPEPNLKFLHAEDALNRVKLDLFRRLSTDGVEILP